MALNSLDDKMLGEKVENYCSSSEDEEEGPPMISKGPEVRGSHPTNGKDVVQTGPKGVIEDWRHYKRMEHENRIKQEQKGRELISKLSLTCDPKAGKDNEEDLDEEDAEFLQYYNRRRIVELQKKFASKWAGITFGKVTDLNSSNYVEEIENEKKCVTIVIHIFKEDIPACQTINGCLRSLASDYSTVKFCRINAREAGVSKDFIENGLPALLVYKANAIIGNFVNVSEKLGNDFYASDLEYFLNSYGLLPDKKSNDADDSSD